MSSGGLMVRSLGVSGILFGLATMAGAEVPRLIHFQGKLLTADGAFEPGPVDIQFRLYDDANAGTLLFDETHNGVTLERGLFSVLIGSGTVGGVPDSAMNATEVYLGVTIGTDPELSPRTRVATAPYAVKAKSSEQLVRPDTFDAAVSVDIAGNVGVGTPSPSAKLHVAGAVRIEDGSQAAGKVLTSDADGLASWATPAASSDSPLICISHGNIAYNNGGYYAAIMAAPLSVAGGDQVQARVIETGGGDNMSVVASWGSWINFGVPEANATIKSIDCSAGASGHENDYRMLIAVRTSTNKLWVRVYSAGWPGDPRVPGQWSSWVEFAAP